ncbi:MAG: hypothetical protein AB1458_05145 [Bacteroidota bacterium]
MEQAAKRPRFLTLLCILTFIGVPLSIVAAILYSGQIESMIEEIQAAKNMISKGLNAVMDLSLNNMPGMSDVNDALEDAKKWLNISLGIIIGLHIVCLIGAIMMWRRKRLGFFVYAFGELLPAIGAAYAYHLATTYGNVPADLQIPMLVAIFVPVLFVILYALNLKHLRTYKPH